MARRVADRVSARAHQFSPRRARTYLGAASLNAVSLSRRPSAGRSSVSYPSGVDRLISGACHVDLIRYPCRMIRSASPVFPEWGGHAPVDIHRKDELDSVRYLTATDARVCGTPAGYPPYPGRTTRTEPILSPKWPGRRLPGTPDLPLTARSGDRTSRFEPRRSGRNLHPPCTGEREMASLMTATLPWHTRQLPAEYAPHERARLGASAAGTLTAGSGRHHSSDITFQ